MYGNLTVTRRPGESVVIVTPAGETITVEVGEKQTRGRATSLKIAAPRDVKIWRREVLEREARG